MTASHTIRLEVGPAGAHREVPDDHEQLLDALVGYSPALSTTDLGRLEVIISLPADTLAQAVTTALAVVATTGRGDVAAVEAMTSDEFDRRLGLEPLPELVGVTEAATELGLTRQAVLARINAGVLQAVKVGTSYAVPRTALIQKSAVTGRVVSAATAKRSGTKVPHGR